MKDKIKNKPDRVQQFAERIKKEHPTVPLQQVEQLDTAGSSEIKELPQQSSIGKPRTKGNEVQLNVHVDMNLLKKLKLKGLNEGKNLKEMVAEAIKLYTKDI